MMGDAAWLLIFSALGMRALLNQRPPSYGFPLNRLRSTQQVAVPHLIDRF